MISDNKAKKLDEISVAFGFRNMQTCAQIIAVLGKESLKPSDLTSWMEKKITDIKSVLTEKNIEITKQLREIKFHSRKCPDCGENLNITPVNSSKRDQVGEGYRSAWQCVDMINCGYEEYSTKIVEEEISNHSAELAQLYKRARNANKRR